VIREFQIVVPGRCTREEQKVLNRKQLVGGVMKMVGHHHRKNHKLSLRARLLLRKISLLNSFHGSCRRMNNDAKVRSCIM
jgi:hypothetical protein